MTSEKHTLQLEILEASIGSLLGETSQKPEVKERNN
jgi:hypothetical protein